MTSAVRVLTGLTAIALGSIGIEQRDPLLLPACRDVSVVLTATASEIKRGERPEFSVTVSNKTDRPTRILDVRNGRRVDLQDTYFELFVVRGTTAVEVPVAISDPGPVTAADFVELRPGGHIVISRVSYKRALERLPPGTYRAFVSFWREPHDSPATRCLSTAAHFTVKS